MNLFKERLKKITRYQEIRKKLFSKTQASKLIKCTTCQQMHSEQELVDHLQICPNCQTYFKMSASQRIQSLVDEKSFKEINKHMKTKDVHLFDGYQEKLEKAIKNSQLSEAYVYGTAKINGYKAVVSVLDSNFMMGSMGQVVGEKVTLSIELAQKLKQPLIIVCASGGARMQEGILSLVQMAKTSAALQEFSASGLLYISVLTHPTTGGVSASFAMLGDLILAEPDALIGFAGKRVIAQTIKEELPEDFQSAQFNLEHGFVDAIVQREDLKSTISQLIQLHQGGRL